MAARPTSSVSAAPLAKSIAGYAATVARASAAEREAKCERAADTRITTSGHEPDRGKRKKGLVVRRPRAPKRK